MAVDIELVQHTIKGRWDLDVRIPKNNEVHLAAARNELHAVTFTVGEKAINEAMPGGKINKRDALDARKARVGVLIFRIGLESFEVTPSGFEAEGVGYVEPGSEKRPAAENKEPSALDQLEDDSDFQKGPRQGSKMKSDPYYNNTPAVQFWVARRMRR